MEKTINMVNSSIQNEAHMGTAPTTGASNFLISYLIQRWGEKVVDKWGKVHKTEVVSVDKLPKDSYELIDDSREENYTGYRNMTEYSLVGKVNPYVALEESTYNAGPAGYVSYVSTIYVLNGTKVLDIQVADPDPKPVSKAAAPRKLKEEDIAFLTPKKLSKEEVWKVHCQNYNSIGLDETNEESWFEVKVVMPRKATKYFLCEEWRGERLYKNHASGQLFNSLRELLCYCLS